VRCGIFDQSCNLLWPGYVDRVTGAGDFDLVGVGSCGIPPFEVRVDGSVFCGYQHPAWFAFPRSRGYNCFEVVGEIGHLRSRHESGLLRREVGCEVLMKLRGSRYVKPSAVFLIAPDLLRSTRPSDPTSRIGAARRWHSLELPTNRTAWNVMLRRRPKSSVLQSNPYGLPDGRVYPIRAVEEKGLSR